MECFRRVSSRTRISKPVFLIALIVVCFLVVAHAQVAVRATQDGALKVLSVRKMTEEEYKRRVHDDIGATYTVRLRYEAPATRGIYVYAPNGAVPLGYSLEKSGATVRWLVGAGGGDGSHSPGVQRLEDQMGKGWLFLTAQSALEWEVEVDPTAIGKEDAASVFTRETLTGMPKELVSDWFSTAKPF